jgi:hypothetical protein
LEVLQEYHRDDLFLVKDNQSRVLTQMKLMFDDAVEKPSDKRLSKKRGPLRFAVCG